MVPVAYANVPLPKSNLVSGFGRYYYYYGIKTSRAQYQQLKDEKKAASEGRGENKSSAKFSCQSSAIYHLQFEPASLGKGTKVIAAKAYDIFAFPVGHLSGADPRAPGSNAPFMQPHKLRAQISTTTLQKIKSKHDPLSRLKKDMRSESNQLNGFPYMEQYSRTILYEKTKTKMLQIPSLGFSSD